MVHTHNLNPNQAYAPPPHKATHSYLPNVKPLPTQNTILAVIPPTQANVNPNIPQQNSSVVYPTYVVNPNAIESQILNLTNKFEELAVQVTNAMHCVNQPTMALCVLFNVSEISFHHFLLINDS